MERIAVECHIEALFRGEFGPRYRPSNAELGLLRKQDVVSRERIASRQAELRPLSGPFRFATARGPLQLVLLYLKAILSVGVLVCGIILLAGARVRGITRGIWRCARRQLCGAARRVHKSEKTHERRGRRASALQQEQPQAAQEAEAAAKVAAAKAAAAPATAQKVRRESTLRLRGAGPLGLVRRMSSSSVFPVGAAPDKEKEDLRRENEELKKQVQQLTAALEAALEGGGGMPAAPAVKPSAEEQKELDEQLYEAAGEYSFALYRSEEDVAAVEALLAKGANVHYKNPVRRRRLRMAW